MKTLKRKNKQSGQAFIEYVILIVVVALAALLVLAAFSDRLRDMVTGVTVSLGGDKASNSNTSSIDIVQDLESDGTEGAKEQ